MLDTAKKAAREAGIILMENFRKIANHDIREKRENDFLTFVDESAERKIIQTIHERYPEHSIFAEESGEDRKKSDYTWIIDPLDGTRNYISGIPVFGVSIALEERNRIVLGVIYDPVHDELFTAERNKGAYVNGKEIRVNDQGNLTQCLVATGFPFRFKRYLSPYMDCLRDVLDRASGIRRMGAASIDLAYVACGRFSGFWELGLSPWDVAAGSLLISEAGGVNTDFWGNDDFLYKSYIASSNGKIHDALLGIIRRHFPFYRPVMS